MNAWWLFGMGVFVAVLVAIGVALPIYGAILDGRYQAEHQLADVQELPTKRAPAA
jgi:hypothetical protein